MLRASALALLLMTTPVYAQEVPEPFDLDAMLVEVFTGQPADDVTTDDEAVDDPATDDDTDYSTPSDDEAYEPDDPFALVSAEWEDSPSYDGVDEEDDLPVIHKRDWHDQGAVNGQGNYVSLTGKAFYDAAGNYYNAQGDGDLLEAADVNDDGVVTNQELTDNLAVLYALGDD